MGLFRPSRKDDWLPTQPPQNTPADGEYTEDQLRHWAMRQGRTVDKHGDLLIAIKETESQYGGRDDFSSESFERTRRGTWRHR